MSRFTRAAGYAAAAIACLFTATYSNPSRAWELPAAPVPTSRHTSLGLDVAEPAPSPVEAKTPTVPAAQPESRPRSLAELVSDHSAAATSDAEHDCLAGAVYFESKGEPLQGQLSVAEVVINRARSGRFPTSICGVVKQKGQFSFVRGGRIPAIARTSVAWRKAVAIAQIALDDLADGAAPRAMFFHATYVRPGWRGLTRIATIGNHVFYR